VYWSKSFTTERQKPQNIYEEGDLRTGNENKEWGGDTGNENNPFIVDNELAEETVVTLQGLLGLRIPREGKGTRK
jgi:hypothetical protein